MTQVPLSVPLPDPPLVEGPVVLRPWELLDAADLVAAWADPDIARWTGVPPGTDDDAARRWISGDAHRRARGLTLDLVIEVDDEVVGEVGLAEIDPEKATAEIGWWIAPHRRGEGLAARAASLVASWAVEELCVDVVVARCHRANPASAGVAKSAGFSSAGRDGDVDVWRFCPGGGATLDT
jgi:RimJ/RimL family protein N-acetyltransferase